MSKNFKNYTICLFVSVVLTACLDNSQNKVVEKSETNGTIKSSTSLNENSKSNANAITPKPTQFVGKKITPKGQNSPITFEKDFKTSILTQTQPQIWIEYQDENKSLIRKDLTDEVKKSLEVKWKANLTYLFEKYENQVKNNLAQAGYEDTVSFVNSLNKLRQSNFELPEGRTKLTDDEIKEMLLMHGKLSTKRFNELQAHFESQKN